MINIFQSEYYRRWLDNVVMRFVAVVLIIPFLPLMILPAAYLGPQLSNIIIVIGILTWSGADFKIVARHIRPGVMPITLAFFGPGDSTAKSWGTVLCYEQTI
ncbi:MAG: hypothetical protein ACQES4_03210 [Bacillota bacterium]